MSVHAISWAMKQPVARSSEKFVLVCLANYASESGLCYPSIAALESDTAQDRKTVIRGLQTLVADGWIEDTGKRTGATKQIPVYRIRFDNSPKNGSVEASVDTPENSPKSGTVPKTEPSQFSDETVPFFPGNSTVFPRKQSQKRDTEPSETVIEPSLNRHTAEPPSASPPAKRTKPRSALALDALPDNWREKAAQQLPGWDHDGLFRAFRNHHHGKGTLSASWPASWGTWLDNAPQYSRQFAPHGSPVNGHRPSVEDRNAAFAAEWTGGLMGHPQRAETFDMEPCDERLAIKSDRH